MGLPSPPPSPQLAHQQSHIGNSSNKGRNTTTYFCILLGLLLLDLSNFVVPQTIIKTLPGFSGDLPFTFETGYVGVGESDEVQLFYYFAESERNPSEDPLLLWLTGGPGCSGFSGLVYEIGPLSFDYKTSTTNKPKLVLNPYSWTKVVNIIFLDAPVGTGFSYATNAEAYNSSTIQWAEGAYEFLKKWLKNHPQFLTNPLYITGDSYGGLVVPIVAQKISNGDDVGLDPPMNLKGYSLGNPVANIYTYLHYRIPYAHRMTLISDELYESTKRWCHGDYINVDPNNALCIDNLKHIMECINKIRMSNILEPYCTLSSPRPLVPKWDRIVQEHDITNLLLWPPQLSEPWCRAYNYILVAIWANDKSVQEALHVREGTIHEWVRCNDSLSFTDDVTNNMEYHRYLMEKGYRTLVYSGDHDMVVSYLDTLAWIESLNLTVTTDWTPWFVDGQVAGFTMTYSYKKYELTFATLKARTLDRLFDSGKSHFASSRLDQKYNTSESFFFNKYNHEGAGHTGAEYKPREALAMVYRWYAYFDL